MYRLLFAFIAVLVLAACNSTPRGVLNEEDMASLLIDIHKGEAYIELNPADFYSDSLKKSLKQSIFLKHNVTQAQFDTSLVWYAHNLDKYQEVYTTVIDELSAEDSRIRAEAHRMGQATIASGDSVDMWDKDRIIALRNAKEIIDFDIKADRNFKKGDRYEWAFRMFNNSGSINLFLGIDYADGATSYINRTESTEGWIRISLQSDSTRAIRRVFGTIAKPDLKRGGTVFFDSIQLVRTRLDESDFNRFNYQRILQKKAKSENNKE